MDGPFKHFREPVKILNDPRLIALKAQRREELRQEFLKLTLSPYKHKMHDGTIFDPQVQRYLSTLHCMQDYYKSTPKTNFYFFAFVIAPMIAIGVWAKGEREKQEKEWSTGQVAYADRHWKFA